MPMTRNTFTGLSPSLSTAANAWLYETTDSTTNALVSGYFNEVAQQINENDLITLNASDGVNLLKVDTVQGELPVLTSLFTTGGGGGLPEIAPLTVLANPTGSIATPIAVPLGATMNMTGGSLNSTIAAQSALTLLGNPTGSSAVPGAISLGTNLSFTGTTLNAAAGSGGTAGGDLTGTYPDPTIAAHAVTYAKMQTVSGPALLGNAVGSAANVAEITLGTNLSFSGSVLNASGGGGSGYVWTSVTAAASATPGPGSAYMCSGTSYGFALTLPLTSAVGDTYVIVNQINKITGGASILVQQNSGQSVVCAADSTTVGSSGVLTCSRQGTVITLICLVANTTWFAQIQPAFSDIAPTTAVTFT